MLNHQSLYPVSHWTVANTGLLGSTDSCNLEQNWKRWRESVTLSDATLLSLMAYKSNSAHQMQKISYWISQRSLALSMGTNHTAGNYRMMGFWSTCVHTDILYSQNQHAISERASVLRFHPPAADVLMNGLANGGWQDGDLLHLFISGYSGVWSGVAFVLPAAVCMPFPEKPEGRRLGWRVVMGLK